MKLYFGNTTTTITTLMILCLLGFIGYTIFQRANILYWGRRTQNPQVTKLFYRIYWNL